MDHPRTDYKKLSNTQTAELTIYWKDDDPPQTIKQILKSFDIINVDIMSEFDLNMKKLKLIVCLFNQQKKRDFLFFDFCFRQNYVIQMLKN